MPPLAGLRRNVQGTGDAIPYKSRTGNPVSFMPRDRRILLLRVNALIEGRGADSEKEASRIALQLTSGIESPRLAEALASQIAAYLVAIGLMCDEDWGDVRGLARELLARIEAEHDGAVRIRRRREAIAVPAGRLRPIADRFARLLLGRRRRTWHEGR